MAFEKGIAAQRVAVQGALKVVYWLCKEEVAHTTKYESLIDLAISWDALTWRSSTLVPEQIMKQKNCRRTFIIYNGA